MKPVAAAILALAALAGTGRAADDLGNILSPVAYAPTHGAAAEFHGTVPDRSGHLPAVVTSKGDTLINEPDVLRALQRDLATRYAIDGDLRLSFADNPWSPVELSGRNHWNLVVESAPEEGLAARNRIRFRLESNGKTIADWEGSINAQVWQSVWVADSRLGRGEVLDHSLCSAKTLDILANGGNYLPPEADLSIYEIDRGVAAGQPLKWSDVKLRPLVRRGQLVDVVVSEGALQISMKALALATGGAGEIVNVRNIDSRKTFSAHVTGPNTVQVKF
jgi:flagellar basal body P-ring formation protein FlgA